MLLYRKSKLDNSIWTIYLRGKDIGLWVRRFKVGYREREADAGVKDGSIG
jgi:hypothetical protein